MQLSITLITCFLFAASTYLILQRSLIRVLFGLSLLTHATNLLIIIMSGDPKNKIAPIVSSTNTNYVDPLPQALILTAIVIGFGITAFIVVFFYRLFQTKQSTNISHLL